MQTEYLFAFALIFIVDSISPGPAVATVIAKGSTIGLARTMPFIAGLVLGDLILFILAAAGRVALAVALGPLFVVVVWTSVLTGYTACTDRASHLLTAESARRWLNRCAAGAIVGAAGTIATRQ